MTQTTYIKGHHGAVEVSLAPVEALETELALVNGDVMVLLHVGLDLPRGYECHVLPQG